MKVRYLKRRAKRPDFTLTRIGPTMIIGVRSAAAVTRFFGPTKEDDERAAQFFAGARANP
jgi:hypothetical protein